MYKEKICFWRKLFIIVALLFVPFFLSLKSTNASAASLGTSSFDLYYSTYSGDPYQWRNNITYGNSSPTVIDSGGGVQRYQFNTTSVQAGGNYASLHFETNIVSSSFRNLSSYNPWVNLQQQNILTCSASGISVVTKNLSYVTTYWTNSDGANNTLTFYGDLTLSGFNQNQNYTLVCAIGSASYSFITSGAVWFEQNPMSISWFNDQSVAILQTQSNQNNTMIEQNTTIINQNQEFYDHEYQAEDNISGQSSSDISDSSNNVTTNLLGIIQSFVTELGTLQATDCNLSMPFPQFMGGTTTVNICQGRDVLGNTVAIISSVALIMFYIPLAFVLIRLIYNEIRSWTNG